MQHYKADNLFTPYGTEMHLYQRRMPEINLQSILPLL